MSIHQEPLWLLGVLIYILSLEIGIFYRIVVSDRVLAEARPRQIGAVRLWRTFVGRNIDAVRGWVAILKAAARGLQWLFTPQGDHTNE